MDRSYAVLISIETYSFPGWREVVEALRTKYSAEIVIWDERNTQVITKKFGCHPPRYITVVLQPNECTPEMIKTIYRTINPNLGDGSIWGIVTGYNSGDALKMVTESRPLEARRLLSGCWIVPASFVEGVSFSETNQGEMHEKEPGGNVTRKTCPADATEAIVRELNTKHVDVMLTSGHSSPHDWNIGYAFQSGAFRSTRGQLYGQNLAGEEFPVDSPNPKVFLPAGNCRVGHLADPDALALGWMHSGGARQVVAYGVDTWYGYVGWKTLDYWIGSQGQFTLAEACFAAQKACAFELAQRFRSTSHLSSAVSCDDHLSFMMEAQLAGIRDKDHLGLLWDREAVVFYGDPAWEARVAPACAPTWTQTLDIEEAGPDLHKFTFAMTANCEGVLNRPVFGLLPWRVTRVAIDPEFQSLRLLVGSFYVLWKISEKLEVGECRSFTFTAMMAADKESEGDSPAAKATLEDSVPSPLPTDPIQRLRAYGDELYLNGNHNKAREIYMQYIAAHPGYAEVWLRLGIMSLKAGKRTRAEKEFRECIRIDPQNKEARARLSKL